MVNVVHTKPLFTSNTGREQQICSLLKPHFEQISPQQILYELKRYGLDVENENVAFATDWWSMLNDWATTLQKDWNGPNTYIYILPAKIVNAVCFQQCICLFAKGQLQPDALRALLTHEYNHSCRLNNFGLPETVEDYIVLEGLAQWAVRELHGEEALDHWATRLSYEEVFEIWEQVNMDSIIDVYSILFGEEASFIPSHFGYSLGYRLIEQYVEQNKMSMKELLTLPTEEFWKGLPEQ